MSEVRLISPLLDNFDMGDPISDRNGVRCCPAMEKDSDNKYIVKVVSIPSAPSKLEALLLSGAYDSVDAAVAYFKTLADGVVEEINILEKLSRLEGFLPYTSHQLVPMENEAGYDVYMLSPYRLTLAQLFKRSSMTHLTALNLALDMCAALTISRRSGYLYVDLKPENIYLDVGSSSKIGDIGFISLSSLRWASLPERYHSSYTAPEVADPFATLNTTMDVYALGLILYQVFNDGLLPATNDESGGGFTSPAYADYEMAEIILKACDPDPAKRWQDPVEMGQAIVSYMQRNGAHDTPIVPVPVITTEEASDSESDDNATEYENSDLTADDSVSADVEVAPSDAEECITENEPAVLTNEDTQSSADVADPAYAEDDEGNLTFLTSDNDETAPEHCANEYDYTDVTGEVSDILQQADELIAHPALDPVVPPEAIDVPIPEPIQLDAVNAEDPEDFESTEVSEDESECEDNINNETDTEPIPDDSEGDEIAEDNQEYTPKKKSNWLSNLLVAVIVLAVAAIGFLFYTRYYLQPIDSIMLQEHENGDLTVIVSSPVDESKLTVVCSDTYGNQLLRPLVNGKADFTDLAPDSAFTVKVVIDGFHRLTGDTSAVFTTPAQTNIVQFQAVTGSEDGSVILSFTIDGPDSSMWQVKCSTDGAEDQLLTFAGHMYTITGLTVGKEYDFTLTPQTNLNYIGNNQTTHTASVIIKPESLRITGCRDNTLTATWATPKDQNVGSWTVHCYNDSGFDKTLVVTDTNVTFDGVDVASAYTVEVTAAGMSVGERAYVPANSITVADFKAETSGTKKIVLSWNSYDYHPENGWILIYTIDGSAPQEISKITANTAEITNVIPGAVYEFALKTADGVDVLGGFNLLQTAAAKAFSGYGVSAKNMDFKMCKQPSKKNWDRHDLSSSDYTSTFKAGQKASFLVHMNREYNTSKDKITTLYVIRNEDGSIASTATTTATWTKMWYRNYCELNIPSIPQTAGKYTISVYFNGALAHTQSFKVTA